jgi:peptidoglycan/LPS O-acetylase OafA/YrhL
MVEFLYIQHFFFCSGYGLIKSFKNKKNYLNHFIKKKLIQIIIPFYLSNFITILYRFYVFYDKTKLLLENIEKQLILGRLLLYIPVTIVFWYMIELILLYLLFYITFKYINNKNLSKLIILAICWFLFLIPTHFHPKLYYHYAFIRKEYHISIYSFVYGLYIGDYEEKIVKFIKKFYYFFFVIAIFFPFWFNLINNLRIYPQKIKHLNYFFEYTKYNLLSIIIYSSILIITMKIQIKNIVLDILGKYSYEIYLYQDLVLSFFSYKFIICKFFAWRFIIGISLTVYFAIIFNYINQNLIYFLSIKQKQIQNKLD